MPTSFTSAARVLNQVGPGSAALRNAGRFSPTPNGGVPWTPPPAAPPPVSAPAAIAPAVVAPAAAAGTGGAAAGAIGGGVAAGAIAAGAALGAGVGLIIDEVNHPNDGALSWLKRDPFFQNPANPYRSLLPPSNPTPDALNPGNFPTPAPGVPPTADLPAGVALRYFSPNNASSYTRDQRITPPYPNDPGWRTANPARGYRIEKLSRYYGIPHSTNTGMISRPDWDYSLEIQSMDGIWGRGFNVEPATIAIFKIPPPGQAPSDPYPIGNPTVLDTPSANPNYQSSPDPQNFQNPAANPLEKASPAPIPFNIPTPQFPPHYLPGSPASPLQSTPQNTPNIRRALPIPFPGLPQNPPIQMPGNPGIDPLNAGKNQISSNPKVDQERISPQTQTPAGCQDPCVGELLQKSREKKEGSTATTTITVPLFRGCNPNSASDSDLALSDKISLPVPTSEAANIEKLHNRIFELQKAQCREKQEPIAAVPDWWQIRLGSSVPQLIVQYSEKTDKGKIGAPKYAISIPHYKLDYAATNKSLFPPYTKGQRMGILTLPDNSKLIINAVSEKEVERVIGILKLSIPLEMTKNAILSTGQRKGADLKQIKVVPRIAKFFSKGQQNLKPTWIKYL